VLEHFSAHVSLLFWAKCYRHALLKLVSRLVPERPG
jgi:hypothetical protein